MTKTPPGTLTIPFHNSLLIAVPCFEEDQWCLIHEEGVLPGEYVCEYDQKKDGTISSLTITHVDYLKKRLYDKTCLDAIPVDQGFCGFFVAEEEPWGPEAIFKTINPMRQRIKDGIVCSAQSFMAQAGRFQSGGYAAHVRRNKYGQNVWFNISFLNGGIKK